MTKKLLLISLSFFLSCHPLSIFNPSQPLTLEASKNHESTLSIAVDKYGIPFINAKSIDSALYGLGFMHARDRLFQLDVTRRAALGTLSEIFGERTLDFDQRMRILTYRLEEQLANLSEHEHALIDSYVRGVNDSAKRQGRSSEHFFLGVQFETFSKKDVLAIARLQSWALAADLKTELAYLSLARKKISPLLFHSLISGTDDRGSAILYENYPETKHKHFILPNYLAERFFIPVKHWTKPQNDSAWPELNGSNAWVVHKNLSQDNVAMLFNDPHLSHTLPSNFYLATLKTDEMLATGATFVGIPAILIGASNMVSWGVTASYANTQDLVYLTRDVTDKNSYIVDFKKHKLTSWPQKFCIKNKDTCLEREFFTSMFGPVIDHHYHDAIDQNELMAVLWTGFLVKEHREFASRFVHLAQAKTLESALAAVSAMTFPGINMVLAHTSGEIAYGFAGILPKRDPTQNPYLPLDGTQKSSLWPDMLDGKDKPAVINPLKGYIITANQNITSHLAPIADAFGNNCAPPYRALRINQRIEEMMKRGPLKVDELKSIQLDSSSIEALEMAKPLGQICIDRFSTADKDKQEYAKLIYDFDGNFTTESIGALPFYVLIETIQNERYEKILGSLARSPQIDYAIKNALRKELLDQPTTLFNDQRGNNIKIHLGKMCENSYTDLVRKYSNKPHKWRWGRHHVLERHGVLAEASIVGGFYRDQKRETAGVGSAPLAEAGLPITHGANLRFVAKMSIPPEVSAVLDTGNSGHVSHKNALDQAELWHDGQLIPLEMDFDKAQKNAVLKFELP